MDSSRYITSLTSIDETLLRDATFEPTQPHINVNISISYLAMWVTLSVCFLPSLLHRLLTTFYARKKLLVIQLVCRMYVRTYAWIWPTGAFDILWSRIKRRFRCAKNVWRSLLLCNGNSRVDWNSLVEFYAPRKICCILSQVQIPGDSC